MEEEKCTSTCDNGEDNMGREYNSSCFQKVAGVLTKKEIIDYKLVIEGEKPKKDCLKPTTYDLTLGEGHYVYCSEEKAGNKQKWKLVFLGNSSRMSELNENKAFEQYSRQNENDRTALTIPAYGSALIQLNQTVDTYTVAKEKGVLIVGRFDLKLGNVHKGLLSQQATQVEPYYRGKLFCFIHNLSNKDIKLVYGEKIATIEFSYVSCLYNKENYEEIVKDLEEMNKEKYANQPFCTDNGIDEVRYFREQERLPDDCGLLGLKEQLLEEIKSAPFMKSLKSEIGKALIEREI